MSCPSCSPLLIIGGLFLFLMNSVQGGGSQVMRFGKSRAKVANKDTPKTTFDDVAGCDEAIEELEEIKEFLADPAKFQAVGAKIPPKGVLLYGPPGTGKTLLAAPSRGRPAYRSIRSRGSDFVEMFVASALPSPRPVRAGQGQRARDRVHRRDRRRRSASRRRNGRRPRRAGADAEPAPGRNGRLRCTRRG